tara:strand:+ start:354 stop:746 length:393 start_codon:yes stop_codon:yes gene_type:complete
MILITCNQSVTWETLVSIATSCAKSGKESTDFFNIGMAWVSNTELSLDETLIDVDAFKTSINSIDFASEGNKLNFANLRETRNKLLLKSDWMANSDVTMSDDWKTYRQALRDLPANTSDPSNPVWPTKPS